MKQFGNRSSLMRIALLGVFLIAGLAGTASTDEQAEKIARAQYEAALRGGARLDFHPALTDQDSLTGFWWPDWLISVFKTEASEWSQSVNAWFVPEGTQGELVLTLDRSDLGRDLLLELEFYNALGPDGAAALFVELVNAEAEVLLTPEGEELSSARYGNLLDDSGEQILTKSMIVPLEQNPEAVAIRICARGEVFVLGAALLVTRSDSVVVADVPDDSASGRGGGVAAVRENRKPEVPDDNASGRGAPTAPVERGRIAKGISPALRAKPVSAKSIPQFVRSLMADTDFQISRYVFSGGGARQTSANFVLQASVAQPLAGFMTSSDYILHVGYQQTVLVLPAILNVGVAPLQLNHSLGEVATLSYLLDVASTGVTIEVSKGLVTNTLISAEYQGAGLHTFVWSGTNTDGSGATPGFWTFRVTASCTGQTTSAVAQVRVANNIPVIRAVSNEPEVFCPAQGLSRIYYTTADNSAAALDVAIVLEDLASNQVTAVSYPNQPVGIHTQAWSGTDAPNFGSGGNPQPNGVYRYRLNAFKPGPDANEKSGVIVLACDTVATNADNLVELRYQPDSFTVTIRKPTGSELSEANFALMAAPGLIRQSPIYAIETTPPTTFVPPALLTFKYPTALGGDIADKLEIRRYDPNAKAWVAVARQAVDWANRRVIAEVSNLSFYALFATAAEAPAAPGIIPASVRLKPEVLTVKQGILMAFVSLPEGFAESGIVAATCDGAAAESMELSADGMEMVIKFRRKAIEEALAEIGESIDTHFVVEGVWQGPEGTIPFMGEDDIARIVN